MKIDTTKIPSEGLKIETTYDSKLMELDTDHIHCDNCVDARIEVYKQNLFTQMHQRGGQIYCCGCLAASAFLVSDCNYFHTTLLI